MFWLSLVQAPSHLGVLNAEGMSARVTDLSWLVPNGGVHGLSSVVALAVVVLPARSRELVTHAQPEEGPACSVSG